MGTIEVTTPWENLFSVAKAGFALGIAERAKNDPVYADVLWSVHLKFGVNTGAYG